MKKMRHFLDNPKKMILAAGCTATVLSVGGISTVYASGVLAQSSGIGEENAKKFACADAGILLTDAQNMQVEFDYERGQYVYEVDFFGNGTEYEYWIKASDGAVVKKELELKDDRKQPETKMITQTAETKPAGDIGVEKAKEIALNHAAVSQVTFTKAKLDEEDGILVYEIEFIKNNLEYEYAIQAADGALLKSDVEQEDEKCDDHDWDDDADDWDDDADDWDDDADDWDDDADDWDDD